MKKIFSFVSVLFCQLYLGITAFATDMGVDGSADGSGFTIKPGKYPSLNGSLSDTANQANEVITRYSSVGKFAVSILLLGLLAMLIYSITIFAKSSSDERARKSAINGILFTGLAIALIGALSIIVAFANNFF